MSTRVAWLAWSLAGLSVAMFLANVALYVLARSAYIPISLGTRLTLIDLLVSVPVLAFPIVGALIASRRPHNPIGWICLADGFLWVLLGAINYYSMYGLSRPGSVPFPVGIATLSTWLWVPAVGLIVIYLVLLFPDGRLLSRRWRHLAWLSGVVMVLESVAEGLAPGPLSDLEWLSNELVGRVRNPFGLEGQSWVADATNVLLGLFLLCILASAFSLVLRYRRSRGEVRQQIKWIAFAASFVGLTSVSVMSISLIGLYFAPENWGTADTAPFLVELMFYMWLLSFAGVPVAVGFAVLKYRLYNIDLLINRTLVYAALTTVVVCTYILVVGFLGMLLQTSTGGSIAVNAITTVFIALLVQPLRGRLQRAVNRLMYGQRDEPYTVLSRLGQRLEGTLAPDAGLKAVVESVTQALKLPYAAIELKRYDRFEKTAEHGTPIHESIVLPLVHHGEVVGRLVAAPRVSGESFTPQDRTLLEDLAHPAGMAAHAARLTTELQRSRETLVTAREEERRRLRRDLHDGLGPTLGALILGLDTARSMVAEKPDAERLLTLLKEESQEAIIDVRRLVYGLRPPALDDLGLMVAIRQQAAKHGHVDDSPAGARETNPINGLVFTLETPEDLPPLPAAVEVACYRIAQEAISNAARHSQSHVCRIRLSVDAARDELELEVVDDGVGVPEDRRAGIGMSSMRERAEELGGTLIIEPVSRGGTRVLARLPLPAKEE